MDRLNRNPEETAAGSLALRFTQGAFWSFAGLLGSRLAGFLGAVIAARFLGQSGFGELAIIQSTLGLVGSLAGFNLSLTAIKYVAQLQEKQKERTGRIIGLTYLICWLAGGVMTVVYFLAAPWLAAKTLNAPHLAPELRLSAGILLVTAVCAPQSGILTGLQAFRALAAIQWRVGLVCLPLTALLAWVAGLRGVILAFLAAALLEGLWGYRALGREYRCRAIAINFRGAWQEAGILWQYSLPAFLVAVIYTPVTWGANALLVNQPGGYGELGLYSAAMQFQWLITGLSTILGQVSIPMLAEIHGQNQKELFARGFNRIFTLNWGLAIAAGFFALAVSPWLLWLFGHRFQNGGPVLVWCVFAMVMAVPSAVAVHSFFSSGKMWSLLALTLFWAGTLLSAGFLMIPAYGALGLAAAYALAHTLVLILELAIISRTYSKIALGGIHVTIVGCVFLLGCTFWAAQGSHRVLMKICAITMSIVIILIIVKDNMVMVKEVFSQLFLSLKNKLGVVCVAKKM